MAICVQIGCSTRRRACTLLALLILLLVVGAFARSAHADSWLFPGHVQARQDVGLLEDSGVINVPITTWPISLGATRRDAPGPDRRYDTHARRAFAILINGHIAAQKPGRIMIESILFVCTGNLCRSPMAEALMRARLAADGGHFRVASAGLAALAGEPAPPPAVQLLARRGLDLAAHRARQITRTIAVEHDLVLVMEQQQRRELLRRWPVLHGRVHLLDDAPEAGDIPDPWGQPIKVYEQALTRIDSALEAWAARLPA